MRHPITNCTLTFQTSMLCLEFISFELETDVCGSCMQYSTKDR